MKASAVYRKAAEMMFNGETGSRLPHYAALIVRRNNGDATCDRYFILWFYGCQKDNWFDGEGANHEADEHVLPLLLMSEMAKDEERG